jgi:hypothetical protein
MGCNVQKNCHVCTMLHVLKIKITIWTLADPDVVVTESWLFVSMILSTAVRFMNLLLNLHRSRNWQVMVLFSAPLIISSIMAVDWGQAKWVQSLV